MQEEVKEFVLENAFLELQETLNKLEDENISLEDSFKLYKEGMDLVKKCNDSIDKVEKQVLILEEDGETNEF